MPVLRRRRLALELHRQRVLAGLTCAEVAEMMDCSVSKISRIETGRVPIAPRDARDLARIYGLAPDRQQQLAQLARESRGTGWWEAYADILQPEQVRFLGLESAAAQLWIFEVGVIPGLLQIPDYAWAIVDAGMLGLPGSEVARLVRITKSRQSVLTRRCPATVMAVVDEAAIRRQVGGPGVMRAQLKHLLAAAQAPNVVLRVLPFSAGACPSIGLPEPPARPQPAEDTFARAVDHGDEHVIKFADTAVEAYARTGNPDALAAAFRAADLIEH